MGIEKQDSIRRAGRCGMEGKFEFFMDTYIGVDGCKREGGATFVFTSTSSYPVMITIGWHGEK